MGAQNTLRVGTLKMAIQFGNDLTDAWLLVVGS